MATIPKQMRAVRVIEFNKPYQLQTVDVPSGLGPFDLLVKVAVASYCHTDSMVRAGIFGTALPCTASHEGAGTIVALGSEAKARGFEANQRVMCGLPSGPCGGCDECTDPGKGEQYCQRLGGHVGVHRDGCFAEYVKVDSRTTNALPDAVSFLSAAPLACAGRTIWRGVLRAGLAPGEWLAIVGSGGGLGHLGIQFAKALGLRVIGIDARDDGLALTREHGADLVVDARPGRESVAKEVQAATEGRGADSTICVSDHPDAASIACGAAKMHGVMIQIAQPDKVSVPFADLVFRDIKIHGSLIATQTQSEAMLKCISGHGIGVDKVVFHGLDSIERLTDAVHRGEVKGKAMIVVDQTQIDAEKRLGAKHY